jgi:hypothetical protein
MISVIPSRPFDSIQSLIRLAAFGWSFNGRARYRTIGGFAGRWSVWNFRVHRSFSNWLNSVLSRVLSPHFGHVVEDMRST